MAKIPVERETGGGGWWKWLLGLLLLALIIWIVWSFVDDDDVEVTEDTGTDIESVEPIDPAAPTGQQTGGTITSLATILNATDRRALVGRDVRLSDMHVLEVVGDSVFYISPDPTASVEPDNRVLIAGLDEVMPAPPPDVEGRYDVTEGQTVTLEGSVQAIQQQQPSAWGATEQEAGDMLQQDQIYVRVQRLEITNRPS